MHLLFLSVWRLWGPLGNCSYPTAQLPWVSVSRSPQSVCFIEWSDELQTDQDSFTLQRVLIKQKSLLPPRMKDSSRGLEKLNYYPSLTKMMVNLFLVQGEHMLTTGCTLCTSESTFFPAWVTAWSSQYLSRVGIVWLTEKGGGFTNWRGRSKL